MTKLHEAGDEEAGEQIAPRPGRPLNVLLR